MTINELLSKLQSKGDELRKQRDEYYDKFKEVGKEIKEYYESPFVAPADIPTELINKASYWDAKYMDTFSQHRDIQTTINTIEDMLEEEP